jgi:serine phosphatase RsbU (regulator of sigma subunit)
MAEPVTDDEHAEPRRAGAETPSERREDARRNRERILAAATSLFADNRRAPMSAVATTARVARSTLYRHFPAREDLEAAIAERSETADAESRGDGRVIFAPPDVNDLEEAALGEMRQPGGLGADAPTVVDATHVLNEVPPHLVGEQLVAEAQRLGGVPVALYVIDIDGTQLRRLAGPGDFPPQLPGPLSVGPEIAHDAVEDLYLALEAVLPDCHPFPLWLRGRAIGVLLALRRPRESLAEVARQGTAALEVAGLYTDVFEVARRSRRTSPAAEVQLNLLPPRFARVSGAEIAGSVLPSYDVAGDWFDVAANRDGTWLAIADPVGEGVVATALGSIGLGALRAARRDGETLLGAVEAIHELAITLTDPKFWLSAIIAQWHAASSTFAWVGCGHPPPLLWKTDGTFEELEGAANPPLGRAAKAYKFRSETRRLLSGERIILYTDGVSLRRKRDGKPFGLDGIMRAVTGSRGPSAAATARHVQAAAAAASDKSATDDAVVVVLAVH